MPLVKGIVDWVEAGNTIRQRIYKPDETHNLPLEAILANIRHGYLERIIYHDEYGRQIKLDGNATPTSYSGYYLQINIPGCLYNLKNNCSSKGCACSTNNGYYGHAGEYEIGIAFGKINGEISNALYVSHFFFRIPKKKTVYFWHPESEEMSTYITNWTSEHHAMIPSPYKSKTMFHNSPAASSTTSSMLKNATPFIDQLNQEKFMQTLFATRNHASKKRSNNDLISEETNLDDDYSMKPSELNKVSESPIESSHKKSKRYTKSTISEEKNEDFSIFSITEEFS